ncbi:MAG: nucleotidyltransferase domain-containing protein [Planctomycetota bacterium]
MHEEWREIMEPDKKLLEELVKRIVAAVHPLSILLFGSAARGAMGPNSDLDLLVVVPDGLNRRATCRLLYERLYGLGFAKDIIVATASDIETHRDNPGLVYARALAEGKELYRAA